MEIDNDSYADRTLITLDSANRPGTLVEVVQLLTELGLNVIKARISSDGGWFVDEVRGRCAAGTVRECQAGSARAWGIAHRGRSHMWPAQRPVTEQGSSMSGLRVPTPLPLWESVG